jgi:hypothetical protein
LQNYILKKNSHLIGEKDMSKRDIFLDWIIDAIRAHGGSAKIAVICKHVWDNHENDLRRMGDMLYTWQYDIRWAGLKLRQNGRLRPSNQTPKGIWILSRR